MRVAAAEAAATAAAAQREADAAREDAEAARAEAAALVSDGGDALVTLQAANEQLTNENTQLHAQAENMVNGIATLVTENMQLTDQLAQAGAPAAPAPVGGPPLTPQERARRDGFKPVLIELVAAIPPRCL